MAHCDDVASNVPFTTFTNANPNGGGIQFTVSAGVPAGTFLVARIRIDPKSLVGKADPKKDLVNHFSTFVNGAFADEDADGVLLNVPPYTISAISISTPLFSTTAVKSKSLSDLLA